VSQADYLRRFNSGFVSPWLSSPEGNWERGAVERNGRFPQLARVRFDRRSECAVQVEIRAQLAQNECDKQKEEVEKGEEEE
jgi:hypothetical protein